MPIHRISLLAERDIALVWAAGLISLTGTLAMFVALPVAVYDSTGSSWATAVTALAGAVPTVLVGQVAGVVADRWDRRRLLATANMAMAGLTGLYLMVPEDLWWLFAVVNLLVSSAAQFAGPAEHALLGDLIPPDRLGEGVSLNALNNNLARLVGPALGGLVFAHYGLEAAVILDAVTFMLAGALVLSVSRRARSTGVDVESNRFLASWLAGLRRIWAHQQLRSVVMLVAVVMFGEGAISALMAPFTREVLGGGAGLLGGMLAAQAVGGVVGAWWASRNADKSSPLQLLGGAAVASGVLLLAIFNYALVYPQPWLAVVLTGLAGFPFAVVGAAQGYALQIYAPPKLRGRVYSLAAGLLSLSHLAGIAVAGSTGQHWGPLMINLDAAGYLIAGAAALRLARRRSGPSRG